MIANGISQGALITALIIVAIIAIVIWIVRR